MSRRLAIGLWVALVVIAVVAPPTRPDLWEWVARVMAGDVAGENPLLIAHFYLMGVWPVLFGVLLAPQWRDRRVPAWPFVCASMMIGAYGLLPFFVFRRGPPSRLVRPAWTRWLALAMGGLGVIWVVWGAATGDVGDWVSQWQTEGLVFVMAFDFCVLASVFVVEARALGGPWRRSCVPIVGSAAYLWASSSAPDALEVQGENG